MLQLATHFFGQEFGRPGRPSGGHVRASARSSQRPGRTRRGATGRSSIPKIRPRQVFGKEQLYACQEAGRSCRNPAKSREICVCRASFFRNGGCHVIYNCMFYSCVPVNSFADEFGAGFLRNSRLVPPENGFQRFHVWKQVNHSCADCAESQQTVR